MAYLVPIEGTFSYIDYLDYMDDHFFTVHHRTFIDGNNEFCYDDSGLMLAFYDGKRKELWAISH